MPQRVGALESRPRCRALLSAGATVDGLYREVIERLWHTGSVRNSPGASALLMYATGLDSGHPVDGIVDLVTQAGRECRPGGACPFLR